jgi:hypothetical protein
MSFDIAISQAVGASFPMTNEGRSSATISYSESRNETAYYGMSVRPVGRETPASKRTSAPAARIVRRLHGFFVQEEGDEARVAFVENGSLVHYFLPLKVFREGGVTVENQPFEMDELEAVVEGVPMKGYKVRPSALPRDSRVETIALDPRSEENLRFILARAPNAQR